MKIISEKGPLVAALTHTARVVETRNTYPILSHCVITAEGNGISVVATDLDIEITESAPARVEQAGTEAIPARHLLDICKKAPNGAEITIEKTGDQNVMVKYGRSRFNLATLSADSFPSLQSGAFTHSFSMPGADLLKLINKTAFAVSTEETRYYLNGIYLHAAAGGDGSPVLRSVATDGHRMSRSDVPCPDGAAGMPATIVPKKTVQEIAKLVEGVETITLDFNDTKLRLTAGHVVLLSKGIEGTYPDYERVTPKNNNKVVRLPRQDLVAAIDRVGIMSSERGGKAVKFTFTEDLLTLEVTNQDHGTATEEMTLTSDIGGLEIGFNARYMGEMLSQVADGDVEMVFDDAGTPALVRDPSDPSLLLLCMPMRV